MTLHHVTSIRQVDGSTRHLLMLDRAAAQRWASAIASDPATVDGGRADYAVDRYPDGRLVADIFPGQSLSAAERAAIRAALLAAGCVEIDARA